MKENKRSNHLIHEKSPYLLAHAYNEVDWYPWDEEAFEKAKIESKPIFLSIGYSTCHWCHVMEAESFLDEEIGSYLNEHFISIKVDKEERPDVDLVYMKVCQSLTGSGGWPLTIVMTPEKLPFFAGTYFPKLRRNGHTGLMDVLYSIHQQWQSNRGNLLDVGAKIIEFIKQQESSEQDKGPLTRHILYQAYTELEASYDEQYGGFSQAPKFPSPHQLIFLLRYGVYQKESNSLEMVEKTLLSMYKGGIFDHVGYGFSRYSVDERWEIPHFEKMLYDNALLLMAYVEAYEVTKKPIYHEISEKVVTFLLREMRSSDGAFYTALDADFEHEEGKYYSFSLSELKETLSEEEFADVKSYYHLPSVGNFEGNYVLNLLHVEEPALDTPKIKDIRQKLLEVRFQRGTLHKDDKILTSWNGLMLGTFALAGRYLKNDTYLAIAEQCVSFIKQHLLYDENKLYARYRDQEAKFAGYLDDYAYVSWGLVELFLATSKEEYLTLAITLAKSMIDQFYDHEQGGFFFSSKEGEEMLFHTKEYYDGAMPSGNSIACLTLLRLSEITDDVCFEKVALQTFKAVASMIDESPRSYTAMLIAYMMHYQPMTKIVLLASRKDQDYEDVKSLLDSMHLPFAVILKLCSKELVSSLYFKHFLEEDQPLILYVCQDYECEPPLYDKAEIVARLKEINE